MVKMLYPWRNLSWPSRSWDLFLPHVLRVWQGWDWANPQHVCSVPTYKYQAVPGGSPSSKETRSLGTAPCLCPCHLPALVTLVTLLHQCCGEQWSWRSPTGSCGWGEGRELGSILPARGYLGWLSAWPVLSLSSVPGGIRTPSGVVH